MMSVWEVLAARRQPNMHRRKRWPHNIGLLVVDVVVIRMLAPGAAVAVAIVAEKNGWGLLNSIVLPPWLAIAAAVALLDLVIYLQHVTLHAVPALWRLHRVHHSDVDFDVTTGTRFHPLEIVISIGVKCAAVAAMGAPALAVLVFEVLLNATAMFNHANVRMPQHLDGFLRWFVVTPDMHRIHHSVVHAESASNFGFNAPWWDRMFGTYRAQPMDGHEGMILGVEAFRTAADIRLDRLLIQPLLDTSGRPSNLPKTRRETNMTSSFARRFLKPLRRRVLHAGRTRRPARVPPRCT